MPSARIEPSISIALELCDQSQSVAGTLGGARVAFRIAHSRSIRSFDRLCILLESLPPPSLSRLRPCGVTTATDRPSDVSREVGRSTVRAGANAEATAENGPWKLRLSSLRFEKRAFWPLFGLSVTGSGRWHSYHQVGRMLDISNTSQQAASLIEPSRPVFHNPIEQGTFKTS